MSITKRCLDELREAKLKQEKETCGCFWNWDDKFEELCEKHAAQEAERDSEAWHYLNELY